MSYPAISLSTATADRHRRPQKRLRPPANLPSTRIRARIIAPATPSPLFRCPHALHPGPSVDSDLDVIGLTEPIASVSAGWSHTCALTTVGNIYCWGRNAHGQLGNGSSTDSSKPVKVKVIQGDAIAVDAGSRHTCAILEGGALMCWGANSSSQLGMSPRVDRLQPVEVTTIGAPVADISAGAGFTCVVTNVGAAKCWGNNFEGQLGNGTVDQGSPYSTPTPQNVVGLGSGVESISAGGLHACAVLTTGAVECWGRNEDNQLGDGTTIRRSSPVEVSGLSSGIDIVSAGLWHTCALNDSGGVLCWGTNFSGRVGDGTFPTSPEDLNGFKSTPQAVTGLSENVVSQSAGGSHSCALLGDGTTKCWGSDFWFQLGAGDAFSSSAFFSPVPIDVIYLGCAAGAACITGILWDGDVLADIHANPLKGAVIELSLGAVTQSETVTDADGIFRFEGVAPGDYLLRAHLKDGEVTSPSHVFDVRHTEFGTEAVWVEKSLTISAGPAVAFQDIIFSDSAAADLDGSSVPAEFENRLDDMANIFHRVRQFVDFTTEMGAAWNSTDYPTPVEVYAFSNSRDKSDPDFACKPDCATYDSGDTYFEMGTEYSLYSERNEVDPKIRTGG